MTDYSQLPGGGFDANEQAELRQQLQALPDIPAPRAVWDRIEGQAIAENLLRKKSLRRPFLRWALGGMAAAFVMVLVYALALQEVNHPSSLPANQLSVQQPLAEDIQALIERSQSLEKSLRAMPARPRVSLATTAFTIDGIEDQILLIDFQFGLMSNQLTPEQTQAYWQERVQLLDSLVKLRYAQVERTYL